MTDAMRAETVQLRGPRRRRPSRATWPNPSTVPPPGRWWSSTTCPATTSRPRRSPARFAAHGYLALCPTSTPGRASGVTPDDAAAAARAEGGVPDEQLVGDVAGAARPPHVACPPPTARWPPSATARAAASRSWPPAPSSSMRPSTATAPSWWARRPTGSPSRSAPIVHLAKDLSCPLLGLFGADDQYPSPDQIAELEEALTGRDKTYEFHTYEGAGHAFFAVTAQPTAPRRPTTAWARIWDVLRPPPGRLTETREERHVHLPDRPHRRSAAAARAARAGSPLTDATVYVDHPVHFPAGHALMIDFLNPGRGPGARVAVELDADSARALAESILASLGSAPAGLLEGEPAR